jgi:hypothetical protein
MANIPADLISFVLEKAETAPVSRRISLYRDLAGVCQDEAQSADLIGLAKALEQAESNSRQILFEFTQRNLSSKQPEVRK